MNKPLWKKYKILKMISNSIIELPTPINLNNWWNFGSILGICLMMQVITGILLSMQYTPNINLAFDSINHIMRNVNNGWLIKTTHMNGASMFFLMLYTHVGRGMYYYSFKYKMTWIMGMLIMFSTMATAFLGYVLPWGQMSLWGATVITNLFSAIPYVGTMIVQWVWGGFSVDNPTLSRFFSLHFTLPFIIMMMSMMHLMFLHETGSSNPLGIKSMIEKMPFHPYYSIKDYLGFMLMLTSLMILVTNFPNMMGDPENFINANPMITPIHIQPEWYFLFAYAILRSIPNKLGGVISLFMSISILMMLPYMWKMKLNGMSFYPMNQIMFWTFINIITMLTWIGMRPVENPYINMGKLLTILYFSYFMMNPMMSKQWDKLTY